MKSFNIFDMFRESKLGVQISTTIKNLIISTLKGADLEENEALYNLRVEIIEDVEGEYFPDERITESNGKCGGLQVSFKKGSAYSFTQDLKAPYMIEFKNLVNSYGVSNNEDGYDSLNMYVYSDYLQQSLKIP